MCCRYYSRNARGNLKNVPYVDNSCKWAGGGLLSTVGDLLLFGNAMLYSYQWRSELVSYNTSHVSILTKIYYDMFLSFCSLTALIIHVLVFWVVALYSCVDRCQCVEDYAAPGSSV